MLFAGPSGTGKTLAASVIARDLDADLYRVNLATVVSKYIGETEKNLERSSKRRSAVVRCCFSMRPTRSSGSVRKSAEPDWFAVLAHRNEPVVRPRHAEGNVEPAQ